MTEEYDCRSHLFKVINLLTYPSVAIDGSENPVNFEAAVLYSNEPEKYFEVCQKVLEEKKPTTPIDIYLFEHGLNSKIVESELDVQNDKIGLSITSNSLPRRKRTRKLDPIMKASGLNKAPKGIYTTSKNIFRVQLADRKFSRNVDTLHDALWLYEIEILSSDMPKSVEYLIENGNYDSLFELKFVSSPGDYLELLGKKIHELYSSRLLLSHEFSAALEAYNQIER